jgi:transposase
MEGILWKLRTGSPWRDIPNEFCSWETAYGRFNSWAAKGFWSDFFLSYEARLIRSGYSPTEVTSALTNMRVELGLEKNAPSESLEGDLQLKFTWPPMRIFEITGGEVHDAKAAPQVISKVKGAENFIADKGYDSEEIREQARAAGMNPVIPRKSNSKKPNPEFDSHLYKMRHLVENLFARLKHFRSIATRFEKLARNFKAMVYIACSMIWVKVGK